MAEIQIRNVRFHFDAPLRDPVHRLYEVKREIIEEDLPVETSRGVKALDDVSLTIPDGQTFAVVGPSGCGKSSLLRVVSGLETNYTGQVLYDGVDMKDIPPGDRYIGMVFQNYALYPNFNNEGNLSFFFKNRKINDEETKARIQYTSELMGIGFDDLLPRKPGTLSGGEKQRVAIARAIVRAPKLFLFDEPLSNLDAKLRVQTRTEIKRLLHKFDITSLYVTHDQVEAVALADQIVVMHSGRIEQVGTYPELTENPVSLFVAGFLGLQPMDLFPSGTISDGQLIISEYAFPLPEGLGPRLSWGQQVTLGTRRETVKVSVGIQPSNGVQFEAAVEALEPDLVHRLHIAYLRMGQLTFSGFCPMDVRLTVGQTVTAEFDPARLYFFDTKTGKRL